MSDNELKAFYEFAKLQDNSDAENPNIQTSVQMFVSPNPKGLEGWDCLDDYSIISPEFLKYILIKAKEFFEDAG